nr:immunoglobulin light chain junction region [Macaca mulatta]MOW66662.1 immunoglobulin light chain junction region [Macaca mulatta]MOW68510.1 immunoglobulin light chain junction region [Macaca mulatta]MOW69783.1 immunoglobulin light chain junction region [Macaca mulatta]MOW70286.1 immunoglobulin light chain junction region [Macaca mulatta]
NYYCNSYVGSNTFLF